MSYIGEIMSQQNGTDAYENWAQYFRDNEEPEKTHHKLYFNSMFNKYEEQKKYNEKINEKQMEKEIKEFEDFMFENN